MKKTYLTHIIPARNSKNVSTENLGSGVTVCISHVPLIDTFWQYGFPPEPEQINANYFQCTKKDIN